MIKSSVCFSLINLSMLIALIVTPAAAYWQPVGQELNEDSSQMAFEPALCISNTTPFIAWSEQDSSTFTRQIMVKSYDGNVWVDQGLGLNLTNTTNAYAPDIAMFNSNPVVVWQEMEQSIGHIKVKEMTMPGTWNLIGENLNLDYDQSAFEPCVSTSSTDVLVAWAENNGSGRAIVVKKYDGVSWSQVGDAISVAPATGFSYQPSLAYSKDTLYLAWIENNGATNQLYVKAFDGISNWVELGSGSLNNDINKNAANPDIAVWENTPYVCWSEPFGTTSQILVKKINGASWELVGNSLNDNPGKNAYRPTLAFLSNGVPVVTWQEDTSVGKSIRVKRFIEGAWQSMGLAVNHDQFNTAEWPVIAIDSNDTPWIAFQQFNLTRQILASRWQRPNHIYRSVGPGGSFVVSPVASLAISSGLATFEASLPINAGVGDALQYDANNDSVVESMAFVYERMDDHKVRVRAADGGLPTPTKGFTFNWQLTRAYTSLAEAEAGLENSAIDAAVRNFDNWSNGRDLVSHEEVWYLACYNDGVDIGPVVVSGWNTSPDYYLNIFTPTESSQVGTNQRHQGVCTSGYQLQVTNDDAIRIQTDHVRIYGLLLHGNGWTTPQHGLIKIESPSSTASISIANSILWGLSSDQEAISGIHVANHGGGKLFFWNNMIHGFQAIGTNATMGIEINDPEFTAYIYNNTIVDCHYGMRVQNGLIVAKNNLTQSDSAGFAGSNYHSSCTNNLSNFSIEVPGLQPVIHGFPLFVSPTGYNYHLADSDTAARDQGADLTADASIAFSHDIDGEVRSTPWDIGADQQLAGGASPTVSSTSTPTVVETATTSITATWTPTLIVTASPTPTVIESATASITATWTPSLTYTPTISATSPATDSTPTVAVTLTSTAIFSPTITDNSQEKKITVRHNVYRASQGRPVIIDIPIVKREKMAVKIYNRRGRLIKTLVDQTTDPGNFQATWDGLNSNNQLVGSGVYIVHIKTDSINETRKIAVIQ